VKRIRRASMEIFHCNAGVTPALSGLSGGFGLPDVAAEILLLRRSFALFRD
jgi:hypothetical protein